MFEPVAEPESPEAIGATVSVTIDGIETKVPLGRPSSRPPRASASASRPSATTPTSRSPASAASAWWRSRASGPCRPPARTPSPRPSQINTYSRGGADRPASRSRPAALRALRRLLLLHPQRQLRAPIPGRGIWRRQVPLRPPGDSGPDRRLELLGRAGHEQVHPLPPLRPDLHRPAGSGRTGSGEPVQQGEDPDFPRQTASERGLYQLRAMHQPLPHGGSVCQPGSLPGVGRDR